MNFIEINPGNWFYNLSVIGFLKALSHEKSKEKQEVKITDDGRVLIDRSIFDESQSHPGVPEALVRYVNYLSEGESLEDWFKKGKQDKRKKYESLYNQMGEFGYRLAMAFNKLFRSRTPYQNMVQEGENLEFVQFVKSLKQISEKDDGERCGICGKKWFVQTNISQDLKDRLFRFASVHSSELGPSIGEFPNSFWNMSTSFFVCPFCVYLIIHSHLAWIELNEPRGKKSIFINAPSFKVMWYLNKYARTIYGREKIKEVRQLLGISLVELALRFNIQLGKWTMMNIEAVVKSGNGISFFSLPYNTIELLLDRNIASSLYEIGSTNVLNWVLDGEFDRIMREGEITFRENLEKSDSKMLSYSQKLFHLYTLIMERTKGGILV
ncbi:hypothetical protein ACSFC1_10055 [Pseudothermotoga sp. U03pept]|uniref:hypothetical protein n=1 Tax=Pseudothermotoga sp. U03pept TaxID=3447012 RepID=UPI003F0565B4